MFFTINIIFYIQLQYSSTDHELVSHSLSTGYRPIDDASTTAIAVAPRGGFATFISRIPTSRKHDENLNSLGYVNEEDMKKGGDKDEEEEDDDEEEEVVVEEEEEEAYLLADNDPDNGTCLIRPLRL